jgi:hypothetical protein
VELHEVVEVAGSNCCNSRMDNSCGGSSGTWTLLFFLKTFGDKKFERSFFPQSAINHRMRAKLMLNVYIMHYTTCMINVSLCSLFNQK